MTECMIVWFVPRCQSEQAMGHGGSVGHILTHGYSFSEDAVLSVL